MSRLKIGRETWKERFREAYDLKFKSLDKKNTQQEFADRINQIKYDKYGIEGNVDNRFVSKWLNGTVPEEENIKCICEVLGLSEDYFEPSDRDRYRDDSQFITELGQKHVAFAKEIGLDLDLVKALHNLTDWDTIFPMYSPIEPSDVEKFFLSNKWERLNGFVSSAPIDKSLDFLQTQKDGKLLTLHRADLVYLKEVQDKVVEYVEYLFYKRAQEMKKEVEEVNAFANPGGTGRRSKLFVREHLFEIDRFQKYAYKPKEESPDENKDGRVKDGND